MKITTVSLSRTIPTGPYMNEKVGLEASLDPGENELEALRTLSQKIDEYHKEAESMRGQTVVSVPDKIKITPNAEPLPIYRHSAPGEINRQHDHLKDLIDDCKTVEELKAWQDKNPVVPHPVLMHYNQKLQQLSKT